MMKIAADSEYAEEYDFAPRTFIFPQEEASFEAYQKKNPNAIFIAKPQGGCQGDGMVLFQNLRDVPESTSKEMIVQRYLSNPLLLKGYKFDLRIFVVITGMADGKMHGFIHEEGLARFCTAKYQKPEKSNFKKAYMHLTNYSVNKSSDTWVDENDVENILEPNDCSKRTLSALWK